jgi:hypothetical protein
LSLNSSRLSNSAIRTPLSELANNDTTGPITAVEYSSLETFLPNNNNKGRIDAADVEAPPCSRAETREGSTRYVANSGGNEFADSFMVLRNEKTGVGFSSAVSELSQNLLTVRMMPSQIHSSD